ncbi:MAG: Crp/Fnr family transcriptional regulator [Firmicutes bacterium]|nr:Crp/Fnr family transcriptional regulator [Bacillota bacterium]
MRSRGSARCSNCPAALPGRPFHFVLRDGQVEPLASCSLLRQFRAGEFILREGEPVDGLYVLREGTARIFLSDEEGREHTVRYAHPGEVVGGCQFNGVRRSSCYSVLAASDCEVCHFPAGIHDDLLARCPDLARALLHVMADLLDESYVRLRELATTNCRQRLARLLVRLAEGQRGGDGGDGGGGGMVIRLHRQRMADILGVTKETAVRALSSLKATGVVETRGQAIAIRDLPALRRLAGLN